MSSRIKPPPPPHSRANNAGRPGLSEAFLDQLDEVCASGWLLAFCGVMAQVCLISR
ncbi:uncharacterized protein ACLA_018970 [Aspergillus clavatus NRRL 1]|uniref:Uncharacterized protein n=1 Tax=Aspergillus clavatus (strain ATCC 1007 / CBS 513.65 / DSM 816 / NCTC 3887 / NRRL 1 / QM 1276 / 107) TaxID=344612 RepID=A1CNH2_ASPCL|nr:uncharacterized protein ACLA_018970 [Aspergillus clavatus NRRL 1]EAW07193.1 hypothetical protein ACLA_018970 [Aspergillus clavatus NRRL 1]